jgi:hypothetical protein
MILESIVGLSIIVSASLETRPSLETEPPVPALSVRQRDAALLPLVKRATECILRSIAADPAELDGARAEEIDGLIVEAMIGCRRQLRAVINAHDRMYGDGSGEAFVRGPFMDVLPAAVVQQARMRAGAR